jgi:predicted phosphodiesterase
LSSLKRVLHVSDCHHPFVNKAAWKLLLDVGKALKPHLIVIHGDFFDFYSVSRHLLDPQMDFRTWKDEMAAAREGLDELISTVPHKDLVYLEGNHEKRLIKYIHEKAPKLSGLFKAEECMGLPRDIKYIPYGQMGKYVIGNLVCVHGSRAGENPAASMVKKFRSSVIFGHTHKIQEYHIQNAHGDDFVALNIGWLGNQRQAADYIQDISDWTLGFGITWHKPSGAFFHQLVQIYVEKGIHQCLFKDVVYKR